MQRIFLKILIVILISIILASFSVLYSQQMMNSNRILSVPSNNPAAMESPRVEVAPEIAQLTDEWAIQIDPSQISLASLLSKSKASLIQDLSNLKENTYLVRINQSHQPPTAQKFKVLLANMQGVIWFEQQVTTQMELYNPEKL